MTSVEQTMIQRLKAAGLRASRHNGGPNGVLVVYSIKSIGIKVTVKAERVWCKPIIIQKLVSFEQLQDALLDPLITTEVDCIEECLNLAAKALEEDKNASS